MCQHWNRKNFSFVTGRRRRSILSIPLDNMNEKKTAIININESLSFTEKCTFPIDTKEKVLIYKLYTVSNPNESVGELEVPLFILNVKKEVITPEIGFKDINQQTVAIFKPEIIGMDFKTS